MLGDAAERQMVVDYLDKHDMRVVCAAEQGEALRELAKDEPDLIVLGQDLDYGLALLREIRSRSNVPVIVSAGRRAEEIDGVIALDCGADDYIDDIRKPFGLRELVARIRAVARRSRVLRLESEGSPGARYSEFGGWQLDRRSRTLTSPDGAPVALTNGEYTLLIAFLDAPMRPLSREHLLQATRMHEDVFDRSVDVQILRLRRKLEPSARAPRIIRTNRGLGYVFALPVEHF
jgi:DNA-binding response OmpR family regulator